ncbi:hypothetical protein B0H34DRAFT_674235 [Crassisporium funariophilum]|nr:hypothetical protein B0H34DRAFT_674235 [Crassisporium funariophilum]
MGFACKPTCVSAAAHLALALYKVARKDFLPTNLYIDVMIMIKNVLFCVAKAKVNNPNGEFWIILLGTDQLEELFGILWAMVGNDANLDTLQLVSCLSGTTEGLEEHISVDILAPFGTLLFNVPLAEDNINKSLKFPSSTRTVSPCFEPNSDMDKTQTQVGAEDALGELVLPDKDIHGPERQVFQRQLIQPINPTSSEVETNFPWYLFQSTVLVALVASVFQQLLASNVKNVPKFSPTIEYPYCEVSGSACFLCSNNKELARVLCSPTVTLNLLQGQHILKHAGAHILHDPGIDMSTPLCGVMSPPNPLCQFFLKKGKGAKASLTINQAASKGCLMKSDPAIWRYSFKIHFQEKHPTAPFSKYNHIWSLTNFEIREIKRIWADCTKVMVKCTKKSKLQPLCISEDHGAQIPSSNKVPVLQEGDSSQRLESKSDSKDSNDSEDKGSKNAKVQNRCTHWLQPNNGNASVNNEIGGDFVETVNSAGNLGVRLFVYHLDCMKLEIKPQNWLARLVRRLGKAEEGNTADIRLVQPEWLRENKQPQVLRPPEGSVDVSPDSFEAASDHAGSPFAQPLPAALWKPNQARGVRSTNCGRCSHGGWVLPTPKLGSPHHQGGNNKTQARWLGRVGISVQCSSTILSPKVEVYCV